jgi:hypothetical protein
VREGCSVRQVNMTISLAFLPDSSRQPSMGDSPTEWESPACATCRRSGFAKDNCLGFSRSFQPHPCRRSFRPGNRDSRAGDSEAKIPPCPKIVSAETGTRAINAANSGTRLFRATVLRRCTFAGSPPALERRRIAAPGLRTRHLALRLALLEEAWDGFPIEVYENRGDARVRGISGGAFEG